MIASLLAIAPATVSWTPAVGLTMVACNVAAIAVAKATVKYPSEGPAMPGDAKMFGGFGLPAVLGATSLGHVLGFGAIQGLAAQGVL
ncbi:MAG: photosystem I reaction center subunit PsaK [Aphanocapsa feldmannii 277cV]|uniref:Photosystem I reaction center subunit PsaK n=2 Tax=Aphanocapsa feldmannii TaxID=192050 RepID=A0A524RL50_9CHRO|nr:MAG: photosystem I reaction center subunit PsaK [Aphanocapsa feldmannii 288cV]TGG90587.1 MAG: photosystem I reaction center subunit PsaK [Aphanocapsa feldmannii 277cV]TGH25483.1 MAG: photosystem I reaction center subunit PsaK [Aphanocapsa feldmannii 277cI]